LSIGLIAVPVALCFFGGIVYEEQMVEVPPCPCLAAF
jgi:hypothetical protein